MPPARTWVAPAPVSVPPDQTELVPVKVRLADPVMVPPENTMPASETAESTEGLPEETCAVSETPGWTPPTQFEPTFQLPVLPPHVTVTCANALPAPKMRSATIPATGSP